WSPPGDPNCSRSHELPSCGSGRTGPHGLSLAHCPRRPAGRPATRLTGTRTVMIKKAFGVDIGGSGIKGAPVDLSTGALSADRLRIPTPQPSTPDAVADT